ncbi:conserved exported hypothetical protein [Candidatus Sulfopaludibacter sp. SbA3]|nr:conserved exported hypothetical protein [Candidatus Sulfopaludibacter sp. SbA3]
MLRWFLLAFASAASALPAQLVVATAQYDNSRTGANLLETKLTPDNVSSGRFGKSFVMPVTGNVNAQPLYVPGLDVAGKGVHDVVFVATEHDNIYAFDAAGQPAEPLWRVHLADPEKGINPVDSHFLACSFISPEAGITPTPVIDPATRTMYALVRTFENPPGTQGHYVQRLHAIDIATGLERTGSPVRIHAAMKGSAFFGLSQRDVEFDPQVENPRAALLLSGGQVYIAWGSSCDHGSYYGWVMAYDAHTLRQRAVFNTAPDAGESAIWQGGAGLAADDEGNVYGVTGNGSFNASSKGGRNYGDSVLKLGLRDSALAVLDFFTPSTQMRMNWTDQDLGSTGPLLLPDQPGPHRHLMAAAGKNGVIYLIDRDRMGKYQFSSDSHAVQTVETPSSLYGAAAYWNGHLYYFGSDNVLCEFALTNGRLSPEPVRRGTQRFRNPGAIPVISANGVRNGIVWAVRTKTAAEHDVEGVLQAYDASDVSHLLYNTEGTKDHPGLSLRLTMPMIANGRVYVASHDAVSVYSLRN